MKQYEDAVASAERAIALTPSDPEAWNYKAVGLWHLNQYAAAEAAAQTAVTLRPQYVQSLFNLALILATQKRYEPAIAAYNRALTAYKNGLLQELKPDNPILFADILTNLASALWQHNQHEAALAIAKQAADANPRSFEAHLNHGLMAIAIKPEEALDAFRQADQLTPNNLYVLTGKGMALAKLRRAKEAIAAFRAALAINPNYKPALDGQAAVFKTQLNLPQPLKQSQR